MGLGVRNRTLGVRGTGGAQTSALAQRLTPNVHVTLYGGPGVISVSGATAGTEGESVFFLR